MSRSVNLNKANQLLNEISSKNPCFSPITLNDFPLFEKFFQKEPHTYGNSWTYITQGMYGTGPYNLGYKYYDGKNLSAVTIYPKIEQPDINVFYWIRPMGPTVLDIIVDFSKKLLKKNVPTYVKKIFKNQFIYLKTKGFNDVSQFPWHTTAPLEDDSFPEQIYDVKRTIELSKTLPRKKHLRKSVVRTIQLEKKNFIQITDQNFQNRAWQVSQAFFRLKLIKKKFLSDENDYYNMIFSNPSRETLIKKVFIVNNEPLGFYLMEQQNNLYSSLYALIVLRNRLKYLSDFALLYIFRTTKTPFLNLGGSENEGIHNFKLKYYPQREQKMFWATNYKFILDQVTFAKQNQRLL